MTEASRTKEPVVVSPGTRLASQIRGMVKTLYRAAEEGRITPNSFQETESEVLAILRSVSRQIRTVTAEEG